MPYFYFICMIVNFPPLGPYLSYCLIAKENLHPSFLKATLSRDHHYPPCYFLVVSAVNHQVLTCIHYKGKNN